ncbi:hypothetical protein K2173_004453 [Erythroxylum novogranatense]|uniref:FF domain-containing protein n=1 Tax=Erythroxylum novogranatense TaxID=1862640 RepID=A0AAV8T4I9_9ROSI|nr:hypothetical protein K2173_004453 [Erythroxylum novogranatense]
MVCKVQDRLEDDERCLHSQKLDRLLVYGIVNLFTWANTIFVLQTPPRSTPKGLCEGVAEELEKQYHDDKTRIKDAMKSEKITMLSTWMFEDFRSATSDDIGSPAILDINLKYLVYYQYTDVIVSGILKLLYEELVERAKEKEEKEAKKCQRLADEFTKVLQTCKDIIANSDWEDCKSLVEESQEYRAIEEDSLRREIFEEYIAHLQEKAKEKERKREEKKIVDFGEGGFTDETPRDYHCNQGPDGRRRDVDERPELCKGTIEFLATKEYMVRELMEAVYFILIDVSMDAIQTGATVAACSSINQVTGDLPVGLSACDNAFLNFQSIILFVPLMLIVPDVKDVYTPLQTDVIVPLFECREHLELLLESIPTMFQNGRTAELAFGAAIKVYAVLFEATVVYNSR